MFWKQIKICVWLLTGLKLARSIGPSKSWFFPLVAGRPWRLPEPLKDFKTFSFKKMMFCKQSYYFKCLCALKKTSEFIKKVYLRFLHWNFGVGYWTSVEIWRNAAKIIVHVGCGSIPNPIVVHLTFMLMLVIAWKNKKILFINFCVLMMRFFCGGAAERSLWII